MLFPQPPLEAPQRPRQVLVSVRFDTMAAQLLFEIKAGERTSASDRLQDVAG
jgi:hypothetical protein